MSLLVYILNIDEINDISLPIIQLIQNFFFLHNFDLYIIKKKQKKRN